MLRTTAIAKELAAIERKMQETQNATLKEALKKKQARLKAELKDPGQSATKLAKTLLAQREVVKQLSKVEFNDLIRRLSKKPEYSFLKTMPKSTVKNDLEVTAKPVGWRFKGRGNYDKPTKVEIAKGKKNGTVYREVRPRRSDVSQVVRLAEGGGIDKIYLVGKPQVDVVGRFNKKRYFYKTATIKSDGTISYGQVTFNWQGSAPKGETQWGTIISTKDFQELTKKYAEGGSVDKYNDFQILKYYNNLVKIEREEGYKSKKIKLNPEMDTISKFSSSGTDTTYIRNLIRKFEDKYVNGGSMYKDGGSVDSIEPTGYKQNDAVEYGKKLIDAGVKYSVVRSKIEEHYAGLRGDIQDVMNKVLDYKESKMSDVGSMYAGGGEIKSLEKQADEIQDKIDSLIEDDAEKNEDELIQLGEDKQAIYRKINQLKGKKHYGGSMYADGGSLEEESVEMINNQATSAKHHIDELKQVLSHQKHIEPWVIAKMQRATTDLSDITHYLDGKDLKMAFGGIVYDLSNDAVDRMEGLAPIDSMQILNNNILEIYNSFEEEGFEKDEIASFLSYKIVQYLNKMMHGGSIEVGDKVKASKEYGGKSGTVIEKRGSFVVVEYSKGKTESYHESDLVKKMAQGGEVSFTDYKGESIMFEPHFNEYYVGDAGPFNTLDEAKEYIDGGSQMPDSIKDAYKKGLFDKGGSIEKYGIKNKTKYWIYDGNNLEMAGTVSILPNNYIQIKDPKGFVYPLSLLEQKYKNLKFEIYEKFAKGGQLTTAQQKKFDQVMHEWGQGKLHSGSEDGPIVKDQDQAIAIAYAEARGMKKMAEGGNLESIEEYKGYSYKIWYTPRKDMYSVSDKLGIFKDDNNYFDMYDEAKEHAETVINNVISSKHKMAKGGAADSKRTHLEHRLWNERGYEYPYLNKLSLKELRSLYDTEFYYDEVYAKGGGVGEEDNKITVRKDKINPNFLFIEISYYSAGGFLVGMNAQLREEGSKRAMKIALDIEKKIKQSFNIEDSEAIDLNNGLVQLFLVSDDFMNIDPKKDTKLNAIMNDVNKKLQGSMYAKGGSANGGRNRKAPFKVGDMVYSYQNPNHKMRVSFVEDRGVIDGVDYGWGIKVALKTDAEGNYDPKGTYSKSSKWMSQNSVSKTKKEKYSKGGSMYADGGEIKFLEKQADDIQDRIDSLIEDGVEKHEDELIQLGEDKQAVYRKINELKSKKYAEGGLTSDQRKLDVNKNGKIDSEDLSMLRSGKGWKHKMK